MKTIFLLFIGLFTSTQLWATSTVTAKNVRRVLTLLEGTDKDDFKETDRLNLKASKVYKFINEPSIVEEVIGHYKKMDELEHASAEERVNFINSLTRNQIKRIYEVRAIFDKVLYWDQGLMGPPLLVTEMNGYYQGRSAVNSSSDDRSFQKAFYTVTKDGKTYHVGHNISSISPQISSFGSFRIYENRYPLYARKKKNGKWSVQTTWRPLAPGSVTLSYEEEDMKPVEGLRFSLYFPRLTNYYYRYNINNVKELTLGDLFYSHLKDQIFRINDGFMTSYAFRTQGALPETYFIMTKKCDLIDAATSELVKPSECPRR